jgi:hypothetical protein
MSVKIRLSVSNYLPRHEHMQECGGSAPRILNPGTSAACSGLSIPQVRPTASYSTGRRLGLTAGMAVVKDTQNSTLASPITKLAELSHFHTSISTVKYNLFVFTLSSVPLCVVFPCQNFLENPLMCPISSLLYLKPGLQHKDP